MDRALERTGASFRDNGVFWLLIALLVVALFAGAVAAFATIGPMAAGFTLLTGVTASLFAGIR